MKQVTIYSTPLCPYCTKAKQLFSSLGVPYQDVDLSSDDALREKLAQTHNWRTVPMIFIGEEFVGGFDDLDKLYREGSLMDMIQ
jgi:glutaredoxin 3